MEVERGEFRFSPLKARSRDFEKIMSRCDGIFDDTSTEMVAREQVCGESTGENRGRQRDVLGIGGGEMVQGLQRKFEKLDSLFIEIAERIDAFDDCSSSFDFATKLTVDI